MSFCLDSSHQVDIDFAKEPVGKGKGGKDVFLKDIWPSSDEIAKVIQWTYPTSFFTYE